MLFYLPNPACGGPQQDHFSTTWDGHWSWSEFKPIWDNPLLLLLLLLELFAFMSSSQIHRWWNKRIQEFRACRMYLMMTLHTYRWLIQIPFRGIGHLHWELIYVGSNFSHLQFFSAKISVHHRRKGPLPFTTHCTRKIFPKLIPSVDMLLNSTYMCVCAERYVWLRM